MHERVVGLYERNARAWDRLRSGARPETVWLDRFLARLPPGGRVLDLGCGTGAPVARYLASRGHAVTGVDAAPSLIDIARERVPGQEWVVGDLRTFVPEVRCAGLVMWHSLFHLTADDQAAVLSRLDDFATDAAALLFTSGPARGESIGEWQGEPLYHASLDPDEYRELLGRRGFVVADHAIEDPEVGGATVWLCTRGATATEPVRRPDDRSPLRR